MAAPQGDVPQPAQTPGETDWFVHDRFGLFIHWGIYAAAGPPRVGEEPGADRRRGLPALLRPLRPRPLRPRRLGPRGARQAGMKYAVITSKHHDGFCLWDSALTDYKATNTPAGRDLLRPLVEAFRAEGLKVGFYHSLIDWHHPEFPVDGLHPQRDDRGLHARRTAGGTSREYARLPARPGARAADPLRARSTSSGSTSPTRTGTGAGARARARRLASRAADRAWCASCSRAS